MFKDQLKLHFIVVIFGFTAILGVLISIPALETVFFRSTIAFIGTVCMALVNLVDLRQARHGLHHGNLGI